MEKIQIKIYCTSLTIESTTFNSNRMMFDVWFFFPNKICLEYCQKSDLEMK